MFGRCDCDCTSAEAGGEAQAVAWAGGVYLEPLVKCVGEEKEKKGKEEEEERGGGAKVGVERDAYGRPVVVRVRSAGFEIRPCRCKSWFCPNCCFLNGLDLRRRLMPVVETFSAVMMLTLTVDPKLFGSPAEAYDYVREKRCIPRLVKGLFVEGALESRRYFCVIEWQKNGMPHWHLLVESAWVDHRLLIELWDANRPASAGLVEGNAPGFGSVRFSPNRFADKRHAAMYATKYLIKHPEHGYPDWVLDSETQIKRYGTSRGFWGVSDGGAVGECDQAEECDQASEEAASLSSHQALRDALAQGSEEGVVSGESFAGLSSEGKRSTIRERLERCGQQAVVVELLEGVCDDGSIVRLRPWVVVHLTCSFRKALSLLGLPDDGRRSAPVPSWERADIRLAFGQYWLDDVEDFEQWAPGHRFRLNEPSGGF